MVKMPESPQSLGFFFFNWDGKLILKFVKIMSLELQFKCIQKLSLFLVPLKFSPSKMIFARKL